MDALYLEKLAFHGFAPNAHRKGKDAMDEFFFHCLLVVLLEYFSFLPSTPQPKTRH